MKRLVFGFLAIALALTPTAYGQREPAFGKPLDPDDPLGDLELRMKSITEDLSAQKTGEKVQGKQKDVITQIDKLIEELQKQSGQ